MVQSPSAGGEHLHHAPRKALEGPGEGRLMRVLLLGGKGRDGRTESCVETVNLLLLV